MTWFDFIVAMTVAILGGTGISGIVNLNKRNKRPEVLPEAVTAASENVNRDAETSKLRDRLDEFWEMHSELRKDVQKLRDEVRILQVERDEAQAAHIAALADTHVVHSHVLELRSKYLTDGEPPWPFNYPPYLEKDLP